MHVGLGKHDEQQEGRQDEERQAAEDVRSVRSEQIDATEHPAQKDREAHDDESREHIQHASSIGPQESSPGDCSPAH